MTRLKEIAATACVIVGLVAVPVGIKQYHTDRIIGQYPAGSKVITLSGVAEDGSWTLGNVDGTNYWRREFAPSVIFLEEGDDVVIRLQSTDVHHRFYVPELGLGPVEVEPGHLTEVSFKAKDTGSYQYYCTAVCGECHFYMQGWIVITAKGELPEEPEQFASCLHEFEEPQKEDMVAWGRYLYRKNSCIACHGEDGEGGVDNINYVRKEIPAHDILAENLWLREKEHADVFIGLLSSRVDVDELEEDPGIPLLNLVLTQYSAAKDLIRDGKLCAKADSVGPEPPLQMLSWEARLSDYDIDAIIAYLITLYEWEEEEE
jgi:hypothetical protein